MQNYILNEWDLSNLKEECYNIVKDIGVPEENKNPSLPRWSGRSTSVPDKLVRKGESKCYVRTIKPKGRIRKRINTM